MDGRPILCSKPEDLLRNTDITDESMDSTYSDSFFIWLSKRDMDALSRIRRRLSELPADSQIQYPTVLYNLSPKVSYDFCLDESEGSYIFTHLQIAEFINNAMDDYVHQPKDSSKWEWADDILTDVNNIDGTILYAYLKSKDGLYDQWIKWLRDCCNVKSKENQKKAAPFNWRIATYKAIKGMGFAPYYRFPKSNITVTHPDELNKVPKDEILTEMESGMLKDWLAIFYQEDPGKKFQVKYSFEQEAANYTEMVGSLNPNDNDYLNFHNAQNQVLNTAKKLKSTRAQVFALRIIVALFCFIPIIGIIIMLLINGLPWSESPMPNWNTNAISVMTLIFGVLVFFFGDGLDEGCIGGLVSAGIAGFVISLVIYYILYFVLWLLMPVAPYIIIALLLLLAFFIYKSCYRTPSLKIGQHAHLFQPDQEHTILEPLDFAYLSTDSSFDSSIHDESMDYLDILKDGRKKLFVRAIPISIATVVLLFLLINYTYGSWSSSSASQDTEEYEQLVGEWKGTFDNRNATITIYEIGENGNLTGNISVRYKNQLNEKFNGTVNLETGDVIFDDMVQNGNLDGIYRGELKKNYENMFIDGTYTNKKTGKSVKYTFSKPIQ